MSVGRELHETTPSLFRLCFWICITLDLNYICGSQTVRKREQNVFVRHYIYTIIIYPDTMI